VKVALKTGYLTVPAGILCNLDELKRLPHNQVVLLTTGSQGEPTSALVRIANRDPRSQAQIIPGDTVIISATPVPGNEALVNKTIDSLFRQGANVVYDKLAQVHVHGHGSQEELKLLLNLVKPRFFMPIHGEFRHLSLHAKLAETLGMSKDNIFVLENGDVLELEQEAGKVVGKVPSGDVYVRGSMTGELDDIVLHDRRLLSQDGVVVVTVAIDAGECKLIGKPQIVMRGIIGGKEDQALTEKCLDVVVAAVNHDRKQLGGRGVWAGSKELSDLENRVRNSLAGFLYRQIHRRPIIIPMIVEVGSAKGKSAASSQS
jgi:ribonuclease J